MCPPSSTYINKLHKNDLFIICFSPHLVVARLFSHANPPTNLSVRLKIVIFICTVSHFVWQFYIAQACSRVNVYMSTSMFSFSYMRHINVLPLP